MKGWLCVAVMVFLCCESSLALPPTLMAMTPAAAGAAPASGAAGQLMLGMGQFGTQGACEAGVPRSDAGTVMVIPAKHTGIFGCHGSSEGEMSFSVMCSDSGAIETKSFTSQDCTGEASDTMAIGAAIGMATYSGVCQRMPFDSPPDCTTGYLQGTHTSPSTSCPAGCTLVHARERGTGGDTWGEVDCQDGYTQGTAALPSTTCTNANCQLRHQVPVITSCTAAGSNQVECNLHATVEAQATYCNTAADADACASHTDCTFTAAADATCGPSSDSACDVTSPTADTCPAPCVFTAAIVDSCSPVARFPGCSFVSACSQTVIPSAETCTATPTEELCIDTTRYCRNGYTPGSATAATGNWEFEHSTTCEDKPGCRLTESTFTANSACTAVISPALGYIPGTAANPSTTCPPRTTVPTPAQCAALTESTCLPGNNLVPGCAWTAAQAATCDGSESACTVDSPTAVTCTAPCVFTAPIDGTCTPMAGYTAQPRCTLTPATLWSGDCSAFVAGTIPADEEATCPTPVVESTCTEGTPASDVCTTRRGCAVIGASAASCTDHGNTSPANQAACEALFRDEASQVAAVWTPATPGACGVDPAYRGCTYAAASGTCTDHGNTSPANQAACEALFSDEASQVAAVWTPTSATCTPAILTQESCLPTPTDESCQLEQLTMPACVAATCPTWPVDAVTCATMAACATTCTSADILRMYNHIGSLGATHHLHALLACNTPSTCPSTGWPAGGTATEARTATVALCSPPCVFTAYSTSAAETCVAPTIDPYALFAGCTGGSCSWGAAAANAQKKAKHAAFKKKAFAMLMQSAAEARSTAAYSQYVDLNSTEEHIWQRMWCYNGGMEAVGSHYVAFYNGTSCDETQLLEGMSMTPLAQPLEVCTAHSNLTTRIMERVSDTAHNRAGRKAGVFKMMSNQSRSDKLTCASGNLTYEQFSDSACTTRVNASGVLLSPEWSSMLKSGGSCIVDPNTEDGAMSMKLVGPPACPLPSPSPSPSPSVAAAEKKDDNMFMIIGIILLVLILLGLGAKQMGLGGGGGGDAANASEPAEDDEDKPKAMEEFPVHHSKKKAAHKKH